MVKKAMVLAAGLGTRLGNTTLTMPKALVRVNGKPMIEWTLVRLKNQGISHVLVNVHHHADQLTDFLKNHDFDLTIDISDETDRLLDTGGALQKAAWFFEGSEPVLVHNADVISGVNIQDLAACHTNNRAMATLCVRRRKSGRALLFDDDSRLTGWVNYDQDTFKWVGDAVAAPRSFAFSGIYLVDPAFAGKLPFSGRFSIIDAWLEMARQEKILCYEDPSHIWFDLGTAEKIKRAEVYLKTFGNLPE